MRVPSFLVTNDDGIESPLLAALVVALLARGTVHVVAPTGERSWISKAISRHETAMSVVPHRGTLSCPAWAVDGTPADCVNLALGGLIPGRIDVVVSGINMGSNAGLSLILASGTVGGALEGALGGTHAVATSTRLTKADFERMKSSTAPMPDDVAASVRIIAERSAALCGLLARQRRPRRPVVHNLNFPPATTADTPVHRSIPAIAAAGPLWVPGASPETYAFNFAVAAESASPLLTDRTCIDRGHASHSILDFSRLGVVAGPHGRVPRRTTTPPAAS